MVDIDLLGSFHCAKAAFGQLRRTQGALLFVSGGQAQMPFTYQSHVSTAKAGVDQLMRTLALEWGPLGIRANSIVRGLWRVRRGCGVLPRPQVPRHGRAWSHWAGSGSRRRSAAWLRC